MTRARLLNGAAVLAAIQLALAGTILWRAGAPGVFGGDFIAYDGAARQIAARGWAGLYDLGVQLHYQSDLLAASGLPADRPAAIPFNYPPPAALLVLPFAALPARLAVVLWVLLNGALALAGARWSLHAAAPNGRRLWPLAALLFLPLDWGLLAGQPVGVMLLLSAATLLGLLRRQDTLAGGSLALLATIKPQLAVAPALGLLVLRRGRAVAAALAVGLALLALSLLLVGADGLRAYVHLLTTMDGFSGNAALAVQAEAMANWRAWLVRVPGLGTSTGFWLALALDGLTLLAALVPMARRNGDVPDAARQLSFRWLTLTAAGILASYHSHYQDLALLLPPALYLASAGRTIALRRGGEAAPPLGRSLAPAPPILGDLTNVDRPCQKAGPMLWRRRSPLKEWANKTKPAEAGCRHGLPVECAYRPQPTPAPQGGTDIANAPRPYRPWQPASAGFVLLARSFRGGRCRSSGVPSICHGRPTFVRPPRIGGAGAGLRPNRTMPPAEWERPRALSRWAAAVAALALACLGLPCLAWLAGGVLAFAALPLWAAFAAVGLAALTALPLLTAGPLGNSARRQPSELAAADRASDMPPSGAGMEA